METVKVAGLSMVIVGAGIWPAAVGPAYLFRNLWSGVET
jgi:hypothetical protein